MRATAFRQVRSSARLRPRRHRSRRVRPSAFRCLQAPEKWQWILSLNPLTAVVSGWRWCILGSAEPVWGQVLLGVGVAVLLALVGLVYFRRSEPRFADMI